MKTLQEIISGSERIVFFGGAGVSTDSGIPDFRGKDGLYSREFDGLTPEMILSRSFFYLHPETFFDFYRRYMLLPGARPNAAHMKLAEMERMGKLSGLITQNIDGLHRMAGNRLVYELHGSVHENACMDCGKPFSMEWMQSTRGIPRCPDCGGVVKPGVVLYGEAPDHYAMTGACREIARCDALIVAGTSLAVEPAASCISYFRGKELVVINQEETPADGAATLVLRDGIAEAFAGLVIERAKAGVRPPQPGRGRWIV